MNKLQENGPDKVNSVQMAGTMLFSGEIDPSVTPVKAIAGTLYAGKGGAVAGKLWQKQDDGLTANWTLLGGGGGPAPIPFSKQFYVDPVSGSDTNDGSVSRPFKTLAKGFAVAAALVGPASPGPRQPRAAVVACSGLYTEPSPTLPFNVSLIGEGMDNTIIANDLLYVGVAGESGRSDIWGVAINGTLNIDLSLGFNTNIRFIDSRASVVWNGGPDYGTTQVNNLLAHSAVFNDLTVVDGGVHLYDNMGIFSSLTVQDGPAVNSLPFIEICGGLVQGAMNISGKAQCYFRGVLNQATVTGAIASGVTPLLECDNSSLPPNGQLVGSVKLIVDDEVVIAPAFTPVIPVNRESYILVDATAGVPKVNMPSAVNYQGKPITVKNDVGGNNVMIMPNGADTIEHVGAAFILAPGQAVTLVSNKVSNWAAVSRF